MTIVLGPRLGVIRSGAVREYWYPESQALFRLIDALLMGAVLDKDLATPPGSPVDGALYIVAASPTGAWTGHAKSLAYWDATAAAWVFYAPLEGFSVWVADEDKRYTYDGSAWVADAPAPGGAAGGDLSGTYPNPSIVARAVTFAKTVAIATARILGRATASSGDIEELDAATARTVMGLGTVATLDSDTDATLAAASNGKVATQGAVKSFVENKVAGLSYKTAVRVATTGAGTLASSFENGDTVDGVTLATSDRILIKDQAAPAENGIYVIAASGAPTRATDADTGPELVNATVLVSEGTANHDQQWTCSTNAPITPGVTSLSFAQVSGGATTYTADESTLHLSGTQFQVKALGIGSGELAARSATFAKIVAIATARLLGRSTAGSGDIEELTLGAGLSLSGGVLSAPGTGGLAVTASKTSNYTAAAGDFVRCDASGGAFTVTLPAAASNTNLQIHVKKTDSSANYVTVDGNSTETIDGALTYLLTTQWESVSLISDGTNWLVL